ncbi:abortive phage infection protein [Candidatus Magnetobacterium bavaricum]|uniref:Abortive phage infection protein n=1 Tax=Candidatus Magnetobacterium bavaricum TaxID=29290 RepID=A0A0F3GQ56_9BACT|nr:abortive phage infection protein [Candidatus Magnetobacterium bavaricum]
MIQSVIKAHLNNIRTYLPESKKTGDSFAFLIFAITSLLDITINEAISCSTDGSGDRSIDAIYIDETEDNIIVHFFQSKHRDNLKKGLKKNDIDLTLKNIYDICQGIEVKNQSEIMRNRINEIREIIKERGRVKMPQWRIHFVVNTQKPDTSQTESAKRLEEKGNYFVFFYDGNDLLQTIDKSSQKDSKLGITTYKDILYISDKKLGDIKGIVTTVSALELIRIYDAAGRDKALSRNIRYFLGNNKINKTIKETASSTEDSKYFWFFNNGVTIVCDKFSHTDDAMGNKLIHITNPKIINGGQTTKSLYHLYDELRSSPQNTLQDVYLLLRLYETDNDDLIDKITVGTNSQNPIFERDLKANHRVQLLVKRYFLERGYYYETHRKEYIAKNIDNNKIVNNERVFQAYVSLYKDIPHEAKSSKSKIFERYFDDIFDGNGANLPQQLLISHKLLTFIEEQAKERYGEQKNGDEFLNHAELALVYIAGMICPRLKDDDGIVDEHMSLKNIYNIGVSLLRTIIECEKKRDADYSHNKLFKSINITNTVKKITTVEFVSKVDQILTLKQDNPNADTTALQREIDRLVTEGRSSRSQGNEYS